MAPQKYLNTMEKAIRRKFKPSSKKFLAVKAQFLTREKKLMCYDSQLINHNR